jgi:hypothetical protein
MPEAKPEEKAPEGVDEKLWKINKDLQKQMREQIEADEAEKVAASQEAAGKPQTTTTMPSQTVEEAGAANEKAAAKTAPKK